MDGFISNVAHSFVVGVTKVCPSDAFSRVLVKIRGVFREECAGKLGLMWECLSASHWTFSVPLQPVTVVVISEGYL